ncbi:MAG: hypothetical protein HZB38_16830 [Planctomycetes bacterium]|nr:hypothetical protein [Planctomycetota bacterium]
MRRFLAIALFVQLIVPFAGAWNARGHRMITLLALDKMPADAREYLREETTRRRIAFESSEVDRWRGWNSPVLGHENKPDHFLDVEDLDGFGLTLETIPPLRYEYLRAMAVAKHIHPEQAPPYDAARDSDRSKEWPGFLPHAVAEHYTKLQAAFWQIRVLEKVNDPSREFQLQQARENAIYHMGMLSHFVGDIHQPLHTTKHFNGWVGENPNGYTTSNQIHSYIDGGMIATHHLSYESLKSVATQEPKLNARDPWKEVLGAIRESHGRVATVYELEKSGKLDESEGKELVTKCVTDAGAMLGALYSAAWTSSAPNEKQIADFVMYDELNPTERKPWKKGPTSQPANP